MDKSGSMSRLNDDDVKEFASSIFNMVGSRATSVLYGDPWFKESVTVTKRINGKWESIKVKNKRIITMSKDFNDLYEPSGATLCACLQHLEPADIFLFLGDGALTDPKRWPEIIAEHIKTGTFKQASHMIFLFPTHTCEDEKKQFVDSMTQALREAEIACHIIVKMVFTGIAERANFFFNPLHEQNFYHDGAVSLLSTSSLVKDIVDKHTSFGSLPDDFTQISNIMAIKNGYPLGEIARYLERERPDVIDQLFSIMMQMVGDSPETLLKDKQWIKVHKLLRYPKNLGYKDWLNEYKKKSPSSHTRKILDDFYRLAFSDEDEVAMVFESINKDHLIGFAISSLDLRKDDVVDTIRSKVGVMPLTRSIMGSVGFVPIHVHFSQDKEELLDKVNVGSDCGLPILDASVSSSEDCRKMMRLVFLQWTTSSLSEELQFLCAMTCLTSDLVIDFRIVDMIKKAFFGDEEFLYTMLNKDDPLWYYVPIANMLWQVIAKYRDDMFPTIGKEKRVIDVFQKLNKVIFSYTFLETVWKKQTFVDRTTTKLKLGSIVLFPGWRDEPWPNIPPVGVVIFLDDTLFMESGKNKKKYSCVVQYLDEVEWVKNFSLDRKGALASKDIRKFKQNAYMSSLTVLSDGDTSEGGIELVTKINAYLMGLKASGGVYDKRATFNEEIRARALNHVNASVEAQNGQLSVQSEVFPVTRDALQRIFNIPSSLWNLFVRNEKMKAIVKGILDFEGATHNFGKRSIVYEANSFDTETKMTITLTRAEIKGIMSSVDKDMSTKLVLPKGLKAFDIYPFETETKDMVMCPICLECEKLVAMMIYPCGHSVCSNCDKRLKCDARNSGRNCFSCCECRKEIQLT